MRRMLCYALLLTLAVAAQAGASGPLAASLTSTSHTASTWSNDNTITVTWTNPGHSNDYGNVVGYAIAWNTSASYVPPAAINLDAAATSTTSNAIADGQNIYFHIRVLYDEFSPYQADTLGPFWIDTTPPSAVSGLSITRGDSQLTLNWTNPGETDFAGVVIRRDTSSYPTNATSGTAVATLTASGSFTAGGSGTYVDTTLTNGTTYYYSVFAYDQRGGESTRNYSSAAQANGSPTGTSSAPPRVSSNSPATSATGVPITSTITISFDKDMNSSTITTSTITVVDSQSHAVTGTLSYAAKTATFTPSSSLSYNTQYTVTVLSGSSGVKDSQGNGLDGDKDGTAEDAPTDNHSFSFTTAQATPPKIESTTPVSGATEVEPSSAITIVFSKDMNPSTITSSTITVVQGSALSTTVSYNALDRTATVTPASSFTGGSTVTVTVDGGSSGVKDENGLTLDSNGDGTLNGSDGDYTFTFTVKNTPIISLSSTTLNFGSTTSGSTKDLSVTVTNQGAASLHIGTASITSTTYYTSTADTCTGQTIAASGTCSITVRFAPTTTGALSTTLTIPSDSGRTDQQTSVNRTVTLTGTGVAAPTASIGVSVSSIEFGSVIVGQNSSTQTVTVTSNGTGLALSIGAVSLQGGGSSHFQITAETCTTSSPVVVDGTCTVTVRFSPTSAGSKSDVLRITTNSGRTDTTTSTVSTVNLYGTATSQSATISLASGWNLISLPYTPSNTAISSVLAGIDGYFTIVWAYPNGAWKFYDPSDPDWSTLTTMEAGKGYWIKMTSARTLTSSGTTPSTSISLSTGWNLVGYNRTTSGTASTVLTGIAGNTTIVWGYPNQAWKFYDPTDPDWSTLTTFVGGGGYWIKTTGAVTWTLP